MKINIRDHVRGNSKIRPFGHVHSYTKWEINEFEKCSNDPIYFIRNYVKIISLDKGLINFDMFPFQEEFIKLVLGERKTIAKLGRQMGKTTCVAAAILWYVIFSDKPRNVGVLAHKASGAREILSRIKLMYEELQPFLQHAVKEWNKGSIELANGSKIFAAATSASAARGGSISMIMLDEYAFVPNNIAEEFFTSVFPTLSSGKDTKICITSTPIGYNAYWRIWDSAEKGINGFKTFTANYWERTGYDDKWAAEQKRVLGDLKYSQEILCSFLGSSNTLIAGDFMAKMNTSTFEYSKNNLDVINSPEKDNIYALIADTSRGLLGDYSAFTVINITQLPYKVVAKYKDNTILPMLYPSVIYKVAKDYNDAFVLVELNDIGGQVADILFQDLEYENIIFVSKEKGGQKVTADFSGTALPGVRTDKQVKRLGCMQLKSLVEETKLIIDDPDIIAELSTFTEIKGSFSADAGYHDDLSMCLVLFSWLTLSPFFKEMTNVDLRKNIFDLRINNIENELTPFGSMDDGQSKDEDKYVEEAGDLWSLVELDNERDHIRREVGFDEWNF